MTRPSQAVAVQKAVSGSGTFPEPPGRSVGTLGARFSHSIPYSLSHFPPLHSTLVSRPPAVWESSGDHLPPTPQELLPAAQPWPLPKALPRRPGSRGTPTLTSFLRSQGTTSLLGVGWGEGRRHCWLLGQILRTRIYFLFGKGSFPKVVAWSYWAPPELSETQPMR